MADDLLITNLTGDGTWQSHAVPAGVFSVLIHVTGGDVAMALSGDDSAAKYTIGNGREIGFGVRSVASKVLHFKGANGTTVEILSLTGLGC